MKKTTLQPKDARAMSVYREDDLDMDDFLDEKVSKGKQTATQALVEFLKTSPEEFQRTVPVIERSSNIFSRIRKQKRPQPPPPVPTPSVSTRSVPSSTISSPATLTSTLTAPTSYNGSEIRKNYIELIPQKSVSKSAGNSRSPSFETTTSYVSRNNKGEPILPNKKRESSLYSGSLHHSVSIKSQLSTATRRMIKNEEYSLKSDEMDTIEAALLQRLERMKLSNVEIPSDQIAAGLATEHVRALGITHTLDNENNRDDSKRKVRHMQVQTEPIDTTPVQPNTVAIIPPVVQESDFEQRAKRAEAALENALDHFEVISGLAYKKLREVWEEKMRWENACMDLRDRLVLVEQKKFSFQPQFNQNDYFAEENEDELGLSEFPCSE